MKLSIFTSATNPVKRQDPYLEAMACYKDVADEVVVVGEDWPFEFSWPKIGETFQQGYEQASGDWVIHMDLDFLFHEKDIDAIRQVLEANNGLPAVHFYKWQFILPDRYNLKSRLVLAINKKKYGDRVKFDSGGDLCQPSLDGNYITPSKTVESKVEFYNYEKPFKTKDQIIEDVSRMDRAYKRYFNEFLYSDDGSEESAFEGWMRMVTGRFNKPHEEIALWRHPKYIRDKLGKLEPEQFGHSGFGQLGVNNYA